jgi:hypothetical protein
MERGDNKMWNKTRNPIAKLKNVDCSTFMNLNKEARIEWCKSEEVLEQEDPELFKQFLKNIRRQS